MTFALGLSSFTRKQFHRRLQEAYASSSLKLFKCEHAPSRPLKGRSRGCTPAGLGLKSRFDSLIHGCVINGTVHLRTRGLHMLETANIPPHLLEPAEAAVVWLNQQHNAHFALTGLVDVPEDATSDAEFELGLVLCDHDICAREQVRVQHNGDGWEFQLVAANDPTIPPLLDPPEGVRARWLDEQLAKHDFILLLFYRGLW